MTNFLANTSAVETLPTVSRTMRVKHFIVTYNNNDALSRAIESIFSTPTHHERSVYVISNHTKDHYNGPHPITFLRNATRPDFSTGHLARNWNQAIINGFVDLNSPDADLLLSQNDCVFENGYLEACINLHGSFDLVTYGAGDNCVSYTPKAVARVGLWDERFCNIGYQEADYFLRAAMYLKERASINDGAKHGRVRNPVASVHDVVRHERSGFDRREASHMESMQYHRQSLMFFREKWGIEPQQWPSDDLNPLQRVSNFIHYPYFEKRVETLAEQKYMAFF
ncbi:hypothetical protein C8J38_10214 [Rhizobium sp. PP-WC-2G-219]|nr:hypothetical protein C8J38_10214 [Rhizobium sp. PP-WC-2G-219]